MIRSGWVLWGILGITTLFPGCQSPCDELAERACQRAGEAAEICVKLRTVADAPTAADEQACRHGVEFVEELQRGR
jgi:hypothetical protein